ncbi:MAG: hypothetical protein CVV30_02830 [Methanomicrobiales archaeon HGW-Methanomicrobiales-1]|jgi:hypothetical protein|nr:MAG: hypothetical protein CVV30_02830 [Methanomicrobiales archaeon HGW-Methanomicrobiales-1]
MSTGTTSTPIKDFIKSALLQIKEALPNDARIDGVINIELSTVVQKGKGGKFDINVVNFGADVSENQTQKISIPIRILTETGLTVEAALKAKAESKKTRSEADRIADEQRIEELKQPRALPDLSMASFGGIK